MPFDFYYKMNLRQAVNIQKGYNRKMKQQNDYSLVLMRELYGLGFNFMYPKNRKKPAELFPLDSEKEEVKKVYMPLDYFMQKFAIVNKTDIIQE